MKRIGRYVVAAVVCGLSGAVAFAVGRLEHRIADAETAMGSLDFAASERAYAELEQSLWYGDYVPWLAEETQTRIRAHRAAARYWQGDYAAIPELTRSNAEGRVDSHLLFLAANSLYRIGQQRAGSPADMLGAIDQARAAYQTVLRETATHPDAAFNYEYMVAARNQIARTARRTGASTAGGPRQPVVHHTIHGVEGGPPPGRTDEKFEIFVPQNDEERTKGTKSGGDQMRQRKG